MTHSEDEAKAQAATQEGPELAIARVAHEVVRNVALSFGDYSNAPWEGLEKPEQTRMVQLVATYLATPSMKPEMLTIGMPDQQTRTKSQAFYGVVRAIAQEQTRV